MLPVQLATCWSSTIGVHVSMQYSATVLQYTGILILQYDTAVLCTIGLKRVGAWHWYRLWLLMIPAVWCDACVCLFLISNEAVSIDSVCVCIYLIPFLGNALWGWQWWNQHIYVAHSLYSHLWLRSLRALLGCSVARLRALPQASLRCCSLAFIVVR